MTPYIGNNLYSSDLKKKKKNPPILKDKPKKTKTLTVACAAVNELNSKPNKDIVWNWMVWN